MVCPEYFFGVFPRELFTAEWTCALAILDEVIDTLLTEQMATRQEDFYIIQITGSATAAHHLRLPLLVFHGCKVLVDCSSHATRAHLLHTSTSHLLLHFKTGLGFVKLLLEFAAAIF